jgi:Brp/Blh family beta-carotene 15,15'-monooxygenase
VLVNLKPFVFFLYSCIAASLYAVIFGGADSSLLIACCLIILVAGLPHGAFDIYILAELYKGHFFALALAIYIALILATLALWWLAPLFFLIAFLIYSAFHFGDSDWPNHSLPYKAAWGTAVITLPCLLSASQVNSLFAIILDAREMPFIAKYLGYLAIFSAVICCINTKASRNSAPALVLLGCYALVCKFGGALVAFTCYFAFLHGPRHLERWRSKLPNRSNRKIYLITLGILLGIFLLSFFTANSGIFNTQSVYESLDSAMIRYTFVALAALTVPHMINLFIANHLNRR